MSEVMRASGTIRPDRGRNGFRERVFDAALRLGAGRSASARLAVAVSETFLARRADQTLNWSLRIDSTDDLTGLSLRFEPLCDDGLVG
jgi:hypothetical protein